MQFFIYIRKRIKSTTGYVRLALHCKNLQVGLEPISFLSCRSNRRLQCRLLWYEKQRKTITENIAFYPTELRRTHATTGLEPATSRLTGEVTVIYTTVYHRTVFKYNIIILILKAFSICKIAKD